MVTRGLDAISQMSKHPTMTLESALCILCPDEKMVVCIIDEQKKKKNQNNIKTQNQWEKMNLALSLKNKHHFHFQYWQQTCSKGSISCLIDTFQCFLEYCRSCTQLLSCLQIVWILFSPVITSCPQNIKSLTPKKINNNGLNNKIILLWAASKLHTFRS